jgi:hypothetical protein
MQTTAIPAHVITIKEHVMNYDIDYDSVLSCYTLHFEGEIVCLGAQTRSEAEEEAACVIEQWVG